MRRLRQRPPGLPGRRPLALQGTEPLLPEARDWAREQEEATKIAYIRKRFGDGTLATIKRELYHQYQNYVEADCKRASAWHRLSLALERLREAHELAAASSLKKKP